VAAINKAKPPKFFRGKVNIDGPGSATSDSIHAMISKGESVINAKQTSKWKHALEAINNNQFEDYLTKQFSKFAVPQIPDKVLNTAGNQIDYDQLAAAIAKHLPEATYIENNIDENGWHRLIKKNGSTTEYKNQRYSMLK
jgi:hypothetical protein